MKRNMALKTQIPKPLKHTKMQALVFYVCGQNLGFFNLPPEDLMPEIDIAISAKTTLIALDQMGYTYMNVNSD